jgi:hypothetical protein
MTVAKPFSRTSRTAGASAEPLTSSSSSSSAAPAPVAPGPIGAGAGAAASLPMQTPGHTATRSRIADMPAKTPAMALMKSAALLPGALGSRTPALNHFLPKTPGHALGPGAGAGAGADAENDAGAGLGKRARVKRRNEMVYHVAISENGSPILDR